MKTYDSEYRMYDSGDQSLPASEDSAASAVGPDDLKTSSRSVSEEGEGRQDILPPSLNELSKTPAEESAALRRPQVQRVKTAMLSRNINVLGHRTSIRLEKEMWHSLKHIADKENCNVHDICSLVSIRKREDTSLTAAIRVFVMLYYKAAATEEGHRNAGHGCFDKMKKRAGFSGNLSELSEKLRHITQEAGKTSTKQPYN